MDKEVVVHTQNGIFSSVQLLSRVQLFVIPWTSARQASLSITNCRSLLKLMSITWVMPSNHLILCLPFLHWPAVFSIIRVFSNELALCIRWPNYWASASASVLPMNVQGWFPLGLTDFDILAVWGTLKSLLPAPQFKSINSSVLSLLYGPTLTSIHDYWKNHSFDYTLNCYQYPSPTAILCFCIFTFPNH